LASVDTWSTALNLAEEALEIGLRSHRSIDILFLEHVENNDSAKV
jgi:hypothetical protein